jgi:pyruvate/2-oxoglutarate dehydrogenase complex dihydrolipoamide acyltransferase (E2) component
MEVKHSDLQQAVKDINEKFGLKQNKIAGRQVLVDFIVGTIGECIGPDPENPGETMWIDPRAGTLTDETMAVYDALTAAAEKQAPEVAAEAAGEPEPKTEPEPEAAGAETNEQPKECPDFGKAYDPKDPACAEQCLRCKECREAMAAAQAAGKGGGRKKKDGELKQTKPGVIASIFTMLKSAPHSKDEILAKLKVQFPDRDEKSMKSTINVQIPSRMAKEKNVTINKNDSGQYFVA